MQLHCHYALDVWVRIVVFEGEILIFEVEDALHIGIDAHRREWPRLARQLFPHLLEVVGVDVGIAKRVDKLAGFKSGHLSHHH